MQQRDTIAAVATAVGPGGIGIVRLSGARAAVIARQLCGRRLRARRADFVRFRAADGATLDRGIAVYFPAPRSYTGEDVVELQAHGSPVVLEQLLQAVVAAGARRARAGEFSERAYLNGKLDLAQAEAVADLIASGSLAQAQAALRSLDGVFSRQVADLQQALTRLRVWIEAALDFPEEEIDFLADQRLDEQMAQLRQRSATLLHEARRGQKLTDGLHVVIVGRPNAGKSSLLNALAGSDRAIVTPVAGTTRDLLRETLKLDGIELTLVDTAGLHDSHDLVETEGIRRARDELLRADLALLVSDSSAGEDPEELLAEIPATVARILVHNKIDRAGLPARCARPSAAASRAATNPITELWLSARSGDGIELLREELKLRAGHGEAGHGAFSARARHVDALQRADQRIDNATAQLAQRSGELAGEELRLAQQALSEITGEFGSDELLGAIFSSFCIGK